MTTSSGRCLRCGRPLDSPATDLSYHSACSRALFGTPRPPVFAHTWEELNALAKNTVLRRVSVPGVQPKLSLHLERTHSSAPARLTLVDLAEDYILKPPSSRWPDLPEAEHFAMLLARNCGLPVAESGLLPLASGERCYLSRRMDRLPGGNLRHMEDFAQITGKMTAQKYQGSMEQIGKAIRLHSDAPGLDTIRFFELAVFCFLTGNSDMHLKNFSLLEDGNGAWFLAPAYDLVPVNIVLPEDREELALPLNGKKNKLRRADFETFAATLRLTPLQASRALARVTSAVRSNLPATLEASFLPAGFRSDISSLVAARLLRLAP